MGTQSTWGSTIEENNFRSCLDCRNHADFREDPDGQDYHPRGGVLGYYGQRQVQDPGQGGHPTRPATSHLRWQATRGWPHPFGLQHPEGVHSSSSAPSPWRCKEAQEEGVHHPKKIEHKRKKTKLAVLKYYKVDGDGKIERLRRECPTPDCGAGVFMAAMHDRQYCGRCHLTYIFDEAGK